MGHLLLLSQLYLQEVGLKEQPGLDTALIRTCHTQPLGDDLKSKIVFPLPTSITLITLTCHQLKNQDYQHSSSQPFSFPCVRIWLENSRLSSSPFYKQTFPIRLAVRSNKFLNNTTLVNQVRNPGVYKSQLHFHSFINKKMVWIFFNLCFNWINIARHWRAGGRRQKKAESSWD